jgi:hypothetical protein
MVSPWRSSRERISSSGLEDLAAGVESVESLLVSIGAPRLTGLGVAVENPFPSPEHRLYKLLGEDEPDSAHSRYTRSSGASSATSAPPNRANPQLSARRLGHESKAVMTALPDPKPKALCPICGWNEWKQLPFPASQPGEPTPAAT